MDELASALMYDCDEVIDVNNCEDHDINSENQQLHERVAHFSKDVSAQPHSTNDVQIACHSLPHKDSFESEIACKASKCLVQSLPAD